jgi:sterol desaturase/sphingolipid hydroxylase (fatty acid hydroxylase superfamily)
MNTSYLILIIALLSLGRILAVLAIEALCLTPWAKARTIYPPRPKGKISQHREFIFHTASVILEGILFYFILKWLNTSFQETTFLAVIVLFAFFMFIIEPLYYLYHRLLHTKFLYKHHHIHHHQAIVPNPLSAFYFTLTERLSYTALFALPLVALSYLGLLSVTIMIVYAILFDSVNALGHTNVKLFPERYKKSVWHLFFYSPDFHADHHKYFRTNYSLFMPLWDKLFGTSR